MLNSRIFIKSNNFLFYFLLVSISTIFISINYLNSYFNLTFLFNISESYNNIIIKDSPLLVVGFLLFTKYFICLLIAGFILFIAMIGSVSLVLEPYKLIKNQIIHQQISRNSKNSYFKIV